MTTAYEDPGDQPLPIFLALVGACHLTQDKRATLPCPLAEHASLVPTSGLSYLLFLLPQTTLYLLIQVSTQVSPQKGLP